MNSSVGSEPDAGSRPDGVHLEDYWRVVRQRAWLIVLTTAVALGAAAWAASRSPQLFRASLTLQVGDPRGRTGQLGDIDVSPNLLWTDPVESELQQLTTQAVAQLVVDSLELRAETPGVSRSGLLEAVRVAPDAPVARYTLTVAADGAVRLTRAADRATTTGRAGAPLASDGLRVVVRPGVRPGEYPVRVISRQAAEARVTGGLAASVRPETNLIDVTYTGTDRGLSPRIANVAAAALRILGVKRIREWASARTDFIETQLEQQGRDLQRALEAVESYKERRGLTSLTSEEERLLVRLGEHQSQLEELVIQRNLYNTLIRRIEAEGLRSEDVQQFGVLSGASDNRAVQFYYERLLELLEERSNQIGRRGKDPSHPEVKALNRRIRETQEQLVGAAENAADALDARIAAVSESLSNLQRELGQLPSVETELARLQNQVEINNDMYKYLLSRYQESRIAEAEISPYVEVVDPATWARPVSGGQRLNIVFGGLLGLLLGVGTSFFLEYLDRTIQSSAEIESTLGLPVLGSIPRVDVELDGRPIPLVTDQDPAGPAAEAYRVLRTNLAFSTAKEETLTSLLFTSPGPAEGKSTTVANLAGILAARGDRTLLIDADLRRGQLHEAFDLLRSPGLSDLLVGGIDDREAIRPEVRPALDLLPAGQRPPNPSELLGSQAMADLLANWREEYRWILLDAPPVLAVTDPAVLATLADAAVLVLRAAQTDRRAAWRAYQQLQRVDARVAGAVLNEIQPGRTRDSYYMDYYDRTA